MVAVSSGTQHAQFTFKVTGLVDGNTLSLADTSSPSNVYGKWTMVGDWRFMPPGKNTNSGIVKSPAIRLYNQLDNIAIYINRTTNPKSISGRSIKAVCSDGRIYLDDWSEFLDTELQTDLDNNAVITIANYGVGFTKMIFKNLSFYDNHLLSKEDCIKAYNYLQTLKAK